MHGRSSMRMCDFELRTVGVAHLHLVRRRQSWRRWRAEYEKNAGMASERVKPPRSSGGIETVGFWVFGWSFVAHGLGINGGRRRTERERNSG